MSASPNERFIRHFSERHQTMLKSWLVGDDMLLALIGGGLVIGVRLGDHDRRRGFALKPVKSLKDDSGDMS